MLTLTRSAAKKVIRSFPGVAQALESFLLHGPVLASLVSKGGSFSVLEHLEHNRASCGLCWEGARWSSVPFLSPSDYVIASLRALSAR
eukprot:IDg17621t1